MTDDPAGAASLWLDTLRELASRSAHDLKNVLNGVAVNLEVARSRSARGGDAATVAPFASTAAAEFERATSMVEALLALTRPAPGAVDVGLLLARVAALLGGPGGDRVRLVAAPGENGSALSSAPHDVAAAVLARGLLAAVDDDRAATCEMRCERGIFVAVSRADGVAPSMDSATAAAAAAHGIRISNTERALEITLPALAH